jgi:hypothetical protein
LIGEERRVGSLVFTGEGRAVVQEKRKNTMTINK